MRDATTIDTEIDFAARVRQLEDERNVRLESIRRLSPDTYTAILWLRQNQQLFQKMVFEPICLQVRLVTPV